MADTISTKRITDLPEDTDVNDNDLFMAGSNGTASLRKKKWSTLLAKIKSVLLANNLTTTAAGYALDARQGKALKDQLDQQNTKNTVPISKNSYINGEVTCDIRNNTAYINGRLNFTGTYGDGWKTMASGFPKTGTVYIPCQYGPMQITPEGTLQFYPATSGKEIFYINCSYCL